MGKAADNEKLKLRASFYNSLAVGAAGAGVIVPLVSFYHEHWTVVQFVRDTSALDLYHYLLPAVVGVCAAGILRTLADGVLQRISD